MIPRAIPLTDARLEGQYFANQQKRLTADANASADENRFLRELVLQQSTGDLVLLSFRILARVANGEDLASPSLMQAIAKESRLRQMIMSQRDIDKMLEKAKSQTRKKTQWKTS